MPIPRFNRFAVMACLLALIPFREAVSIVLSDRDGDYEMTANETKYGLDFSGVVVWGFASQRPNSIQEIENLGRCSASLISDRHLLTAAHCIDNDYDGVIDDQVSERYAGFETTEGDVLIQIRMDAARQVLPWPGAFPPGDFPDLAVLELSQDAPASVPRYALYGLSDEIGEIGTLSGYGLTGFGDVGVDVGLTFPYAKRAGLNRAEQFYGDRQIYLGIDFDSGADEQNTFQLQGTESDLGLGTDEVLTSEGDSGGPLFIDGVIAGVISFNAWPIQGDVNDLFDESWGEAGFSTRVSAYRDFILDATEGEAVFLNTQGDFNLNGTLDVEDVNQLAEQLRATSSHALFDVDDDGQLTFDDHRHWVRHLRGTSYGDTDLNGSFTSHDLMLVWQAGQYEDALLGNSTWDTGDWNGDGEFTTNDFVLAFMEGGYESVDDSSATSVPESRTEVTFILAALGLLITHHNRTHRVVWP